MEEPGPDPELELSDLPGSRADIRIDRASVGIRGFGFEIRAALARDLRGRPSAPPSEMLAGRSSRLVVVVVCLTLVATVAVVAGMVLPPAGASFTARALTCATAFAALFGAALLIVRLLPAGGGRS